MREHVITLVHLSAQLKGSRGLEDAFRGHIEGDWGVLRGIRERLGVSFCVRIGSS